MAAWNRRRFCASGAAGLGAVGLGSWVFSASGRAQSGPGPEVAEARHEGDLPTPALLVEEFGAPKRGSALRHGEICRTLTATQVKSRTSVGPLGLTPPRFFSSHPWFFRPPPV
jgi:hypothetical protein